MNRTVVVMALLCEIDTTVSTKETAQTLVVGDGTTTRPHDFGNFLLFNHGPIVSSVTA